MKISNFRDCKELPRKQFESAAYVAKVDVTTGYLWWKKTETKEVGSSFSIWHFLKTGKLTPRFEVENLFSVWQTKQRME